jgi:hypothetical protein
LDAQLDKPSFLLEPLIGQLRLGTVNMVENITEIVWFLILCPFNRLGIAVVLMNVGSDSPNIFA